MKTTWIDLRTRSMVGHNNSLSSSNFTARAEREKTVGKMDRVYSSRGRRGATRSAHRSHLHSFVNVPWWSNGLVGWYVCDIIKKFIQSKENPQESSSGHSGFGRLPGDP